VIEGASAKPALRLGFTSVRLASIYSKEARLKLKSVALMVFRLILLIMVMLLSLVMATSIASPGAASQPPEEAGQAAWALLGVSLVNALVLAYPIVRSRWHGLGLIGTVFFVLFGTQTFMSQIETLFFGSAFDISADEMRNIILSGALTALFFSPLAVLTLGKMRRVAEHEEANQRLIMPWHGWAWRLVLLPVIYVCLYFMFGYFVAWQSPEVREFYSGSTALEPFLAHMFGVVQHTSWIFPFQILRGLLWIGLALPIIKMMKGKPWETSLAVGLLLGLLLTTQLLFPNPYMPAPVRLAHFIETSTSTFIYGWLIGWLFSRQPSSRGLR